MSPFMLNWTMNYIDSIDRSASFYNSTFIRPVTASSCCKLWYFCER